MLKVAEEQESQGFEMSPQSPGLSSIEKKHMRVRRAINLTRLHWFSKEVGSVEGHLKIMKQAEQFKGSFTKY